MDLFEHYLQFQKKVTVFKLKIIHFPVKEGVMINEIVWIWGSN